MRNANRGELGCEEAIDVLKVVLFVHPMEAQEVWEHVLGEVRGDARENGREIGEIRIGVELFNMWGVEGDAFPVGWP